jgi:hypothetical protein
MYTHFNSIQSRPHQLSTWTLLFNQIKNLNEHSTCTIFLFASPKSLIVEPWMSLIHHIIENNTLKQICIDEVHLYVIFAISFRHLFLKLRTILFDKVQTFKNSNIPTTSPTDIPTSVFKVPILLMTATFNIKLLNYLQQIIDFVVPNPTMFLV